MKFARQGLIRAVPRHHTPLLEKQIGDFVEAVWEVQNISPTEVVGAYLAFFSEAGTLIQLGEGDATILNPGQIGDLFGVWEILPGTSLGLFAPTVRVFQVVPDPPGSFPAVPQPGQDIFIESHSFTVNISDPGPTPGFIQPSSAVGQPVIG